MNADQDNRECTRINANVFVRRFVLVLVVVLVLEFWGAERWSVGVLEFCASSELHPATAGLGLLLRNEVNQGGIPGWSKHCHPDSDEDGRRGGNGSNLVASAQICVLSRAFAVGPHLRLVRVLAVVFRKTPQDEQDPDSSP
jgi:hypothetical protein